MELRPALASKAIEVLPKLEDRNLANPNYKADEAYVPPTTMPAPKENAAGPPTTARTQTASTVQTRNAALPTTTVARAATTIAAAAKPPIAETKNTAKTPETEPAMSDIKQPTANFDDNCPESFPKADCDLMFRTGKPPDFLALGKSKWVKMCSKLLKRSEADCETEFAGATSGGKEGGPQGDQPGQVVATQPGKPGTTQPGKPGTVQPGQPGTTQPGQPGTVQPGQ